MLIAIKGTFKNDKNPTVAMIPKMTEKLPATPNQGLARTQSLAKRLDTT